MWMVDKKNIKRINKISWYFSSRSIRRQKFNLVLTVLNFHDGMLDRSISDREFKGHSEVRQYYELFLCHCNIKRSKYLCNGKRISSAFPDKNWIWQIAFLASSIFLKYCIDLQDEFFYIKPRLELKRDFKH